MLFANSCTPRRHSSFPNKAHSIIGDKNQYLYPVESQANWLANNTEPTWCLKRSNEINNDTQIWCSHYQLPQFVVLLVTIRVDIILLIYLDFKLIATKNLQFQVQIKGKAVSDTAERKFSQISERVYGWQDIFNLGMARMKLMMERNLRSASTTAAAKLYKFVESRNCFFSNFVTHSHTTMTHNSCRAQLHLQTVRHAVSFLDVFAKLRRTTISFAMSVYLSVRPSA